MHGLINRSIQCFLRDMHGPEIWDAVAMEANLGFPSFEGMLEYPPEMTEQVIDAACRITRVRRDLLLEDLGSYLVSHPSLDPLRRLLRFGGVTYGDFLNTLEELPERARLAVPDLDLPVVNMAEGPRGGGLLAIQGCFVGVGHVAVGLLRAMAVDYGALVVLDWLGNPNGWETISIRVLDQEWTPGRRFELAREAV